MDKNISISVRYLSLIAGGLLLLGVGYMWGNRTGSREAAFTALQDPMTAMPMVKVLPPLLSPIDQLLLDNPQLTKEKAEAYQKEHIAIERADIEVQNAMLKKGATPNEMLQFNAGLAEQRLAKIKKLQEQYGVVVKQQELPMNTPTPGELTIPLADTTGE